MTLSSANVDAVALLVPLLAVGLVMALVLREYPRQAFVGWLLAFAFVPVWWGVDLGAYIPPATLLGVLLLGMLVPYPEFRATGMDRFVAAFAVACLAPVVIGATTVPSMFVVVLVWGVGYLLGRLMPSRVGLEWIYAVLAITFSVVALVAIAEFLLSWNPFVSVPVNNSLYETWGPLQERGGVLRSEAAFGHSIALGASMALTIPIVLASPLRPGIRAVMTAIMLVSVLVTFSRIAIICSGLAVALSMWSLRTEISARARGAIAAAAFTLAAIALPYVSGVFTTAGSEATGSAAYRGALLSLVDEFSIIGFSTGAYRDASGDLRFGAFRSIDSALILTGLTYGWVAILLLLGILATAVVLVVLRRATAPTVAIVAQIPAFATVALITQYSLYAWFIGGLAVASQAMRVRAAEGSPASGATQPGTLPEPAPQSWNTAVRTGGTRATS